MRIRATDDYRHPAGECNVDDCRRNYCSTHRLLFRDCATVERVPSRIYCEEPPYSVIFEVTGECPICKKEFRRTVSYS
jgi:hypothetical protein